MTVGRVGFPSRRAVERTRLPALRLAPSSRRAQKFARFLLLLLAATVAAIAFVPWQQTSRGSGRVVAFVPQERQQTITSPVKGVVANVADGIVEGSRVRQGELILEIQPQAANLVEQLRAQLQDMEAKLATAQVKAEAYGQNVVDLTAARDFAVQAADELVKAAQAKLQAKQEAIPGYEAKELQTRLNYERQLSLFEKGIKSQLEVEKQKKDWDVAIAELEAAQREATAAERELASKEQELEQKRREAQTKVDYARAMEQDALGQAATVQKEMRDVEIKLAEMRRLVIEAPRDGTIFRMPVFERGQAIKEGDALFTLIPDAAEEAVELWISGNDAPLVRPGDHVRLQFEGWPAIQFAGWPSVAVGTFGGEVAMIDAADNGQGRFRVLVKPTAEDPWPSENYLRQGVRANGWVMLRQVTLGYEIWRQLNGFPAAASDSVPSGDGKTNAGDLGGKVEKDDKSKVKLPK
jgi:multidrug resistance efflux pump